LTTLEHRDVCEPIGSLVHHHEVAPRRTTLATCAAAALERLGVERVEQRRPVDVDAAELAGIDVLHRSTGLDDRAVAGTRAAALGPTTPTAPAPAFLGAVGGCRRRGRHGR